VIAIYYVLTDKSLRVKPITKVQCPCSKQIIHYCLYSTSFISAKWLLSVLHCLIMFIVFETKSLLFALYFKESSGSNFPCLDWSLKWLVNAFYSILSSDLRAEGEWN
jgi:hypothetical protein